MRTFLRIWTALLIAGALLAYPAALIASKRTVSATVTKTERITTGTDSYYLVWTDKGTFKNTDTLLFGKWNSSDLQGRLAEGELLTLEVAGWRIPFLSTYPNVISVR